MKAENPLDLHLKLNKRMPPGWRDAVTDVADLLDLAWMATQSVFEERATPELALGVFEERATPELALGVFDRLASRLQVQASLDSAAHEQE